MFPFSLSGFFLAYFCALLFVVFMGIIGKDTGLRQVYVKLLLKIFEYGRVKIERAQVKRKISQDELTEGAKSEAKKTLEANGSSSPTDIIARENLVLAPGIQRDLSVPNLKEKGELDDPPENGKTKKELGFHMAHALDFIKAGVEAIIQDEVTQRFDAAELQSWNLLTRTNQNYEFVSVRLTLIWFCGFLFRYLVLFPFRVILTAIGVLWLSTTTMVIGSVPNRALKRKLYAFVSLATFRIFGRALSAIITYHNVENRPKGGICVANHTSPIDVVMLHCDHVYSLVGQRHGGFLGVLQNALIRASSHLWFERSELKDRKIVADRMKQHVEDPEKPPILIFPEGTCINNTSVMQFKKGSFEIDATIYPVAIKYDPKFGDAFWNSSRDNYLQYLAHMLSNWATVVDIWYLPVMQREEGETAVDFANRVKSEIAKQGGLVDLVWDGQLKRMEAKKEWKEQQQKLFVDRLKSE